MKYSEFRRWLERKEAKFTSHKRGCHFDVELNGEFTTFPDHGPKEIGEKLRNKILKDLKLK
jgi:mRNA interferase HicA